MTVAVKVIDQGLRDDFGFEHLLWVYSGRRGIHCWVCDKRARQLSNEARAAVAEYFSVYKGTDASGLVKRVNISNPLHPSLQRGMDTMNRYWRDVYLPEQQLLEDAKYCDPVLAMIPVADVREQVADSWKRSPKDDSVAKWDKLEKIVERAKKATKGGPDKWALDKCVNEIIFAHIYPRLDVEVSKHMNHLLKAPFCVHPKTGRVCVPMDPKDDDFDPNKVPTVIQLIDEMNAAKAAGKEGPFLQRDGHERRGGDV
jgi:DNA primase small subunit